MRETMSLCLCWVFAGALAAGAQSLRQSSFYFPGDGQRNNNEQIGDFCCTGETATVYTTSGDPVGYIYFYDFRDAYNVGDTSIAGTFGVLVSGATSLVSPGSPRQQSAVSFLASEMWRDASRSTVAGELSYTATILSAELTNDRSAFYMNSV